MNGSLRKQPARATSQSRTAAADVESIFEDLRRSPERRTARAGELPGEGDRRSSGSERRRMRVVGAEDCWWLRRNYLTVEAKLFVSGELQRNPRS